MSKGDIEIYGAQYDPSDPYKWENAKKEVLSQYLKVGSNILFFDDTPENIKAASNLNNELSQHKGIGKIKAKQVIVPQESTEWKAGYLLEEPTNTMWDYINEKSDIYDVIVFDFDFTLSDIHSGGVTLQAIGPSYIDVTVEKGFINVPIMITKERYETLLVELQKIAETKTLVILSRGALDALVNAFTKMGFNVTKSIGMGFHHDGSVVLIENRPDNLIEEYERKQAEDVKFSFSDSDGGVGRKGYNKRNQNYKKNTRRKKPKLRKKNINKLVEKLKKRKKKIKGIKELKQNNTKILY